ncbi:TIR domain-containing protein [Nonomuraea bangladeshensis]|uniref:TIR domain-containing protein n=1 Tax=Nonomuraea bangladeshensis TaxID=404385 RepID=A0ABV3HEF3_9ACTN
MGPDEYDVFLSYAGDDREEARALEDALRGAKVRGRPLRVFRDERSIGHHESITRKITEGVLRSAVLLAYYSRAYPTRPACQLELTFAFLLAQRSRTVRGRVLVVNPEDGSDHIEPVELRDLKYRRPPASEPERRRFAEEVAERVAALSGPLGAAASAEPPHWWPGEPLPDREAVHRYAELWRLHSALHAGTSALVAPGPRMGVAVVSGLPGSGKTTLAAQYAQEFAAAFPGGVHWFTLDPEKTGPDLLLDYRRLVRDMAVATAIPLAGVPDDRLLPQVAAHFRGRAEPALWIVDQLPAGISDETVRKLLIPSRYVRTILTCQEDRFTDLGGPVRLGGLTEAEGLALLRDAYGPGEEAEAAALVRDLSGHPHDLRMAGAELRTGRGMISLTEYRHQVAGTADSVLADILRELDIPAWTVLGLASFLAPAPLPRALLSRAAALLHGWSRQETQERLLPALESLTRRCLIAAAGECVSVHARVLRAVPEPARRGCLPAAARAVAEHLTAPEPGPEVVAHARHLVTLENLPADVAETLLSSLAALDERSSPLTARLRERHGDDDPRTRAALLLVTVADHISARTPLPRGRVVPMAAAAVAGLVAGLVIFELTRIGGRGLSVAAGAVAGMACVVVARIRNRSSPPAEVKLTFVVDDESRDVAWKLFVEITTRVSTQPLNDDEGLTREALSSLYGLFATVRDTLKAGRPSVPAGGRTVEQLAITMLNQELRPFLSKWHPRLREFEQAHPDTPEPAWPGNAACRVELQQVQGRIQDYAKQFGELAGVSG